MPAAIKRRGEHIMFEWLIPLLIVGPVKLTHFPIRTLVTPENLSPDPRLPFPAKPRRGYKA